MNYERVIESEDLVLVLMERVGVGVCSSSIERKNSLPASIDVAWKG